MCVRIVYSGAKNMNMSGVNLSAHTVPCCCLCLSRISDHRKRKRLRKDDCSEAREVLVSLSDSHLLQKMLQDHTAVLCSDCQRDLYRIAKLNIELVK